jgi:hypothetical protein
MDLSVQASNNLLIVFGIDQIGEIPKVAPKVNVISNGPLVKVHVVVLNFFNS